MATKRTTPAPAKKKGAKARPKIRCWQDDPGIPGGGAQPVQAEAPQLSRRLPVAITKLGPPPALYDLGTAEFRYWAAAEALQRSAALWADLLPAGVTWHPANGRKLPVGLDEGEDLNAYYDRNGLHFFRAPVGGHVVHSGESPDVCAHELGHAVLDALRPQLWDASFIEAGAFHESFGDISSLLAGLQLPSVRDAVLVETSGRLYRTSRLSRVAEQLGWAIRQIRPEVVDPDCLRNAVNSFFYTDPSTLPPIGPASSLTSQPHSFSRVFTGGFLEALAGMHVVLGGDSAALLQAALDAGALVVGAVVASPIVPAYFSQLAAHMVEVDATRFEARYAEALKRAFVKHGILSLEAANAVVASPAGGRPAGGPPARAMAGEAVTAASRVAAAAAPPLVPLPGWRYGLSGDLLVPALAETKRFGVAGSAPDLGSVASPSHDQAARSFVEDLFRRGKVEVTAPDDDRRVAHSTHAVRAGPDGLVLARTSVDCGFDVFR